MEVSTMITKIILMFLSGIILDILVTKYTQYVSKEKAYAASFLSGVLTMGNFVLFTFILKDVENTMANIIAFSGGNTVGTFLAMIKKF
jgi:hypothetical protein